MRLKALALLLLWPFVLSAAQIPGIPEGWSSNYVYANGVRLHYYRAIPAPGKPVIVMVHGVTDIGLNWTVLSAELQKDYDIYMLDARAHGLSDPFTPSDNGSTLVEDVVAVVKTLKLENPILIGHSMGAATVMRIGAEYPDLPKAVVMLDPGLGRRPPPPKPTEVPTAKEATTNTEPVKAVSRDRISTTMRGSPETLVAQNNANFDDLVATAQRQTPKWSLLSCQYWALSKKQYHGPYDDASRQAMFGTMSTGEALAKIRVPALILKADAPPETRKTHEEAASALKNGRLVYVEGGGHNLHHDEPQKTLGFLKEFLSSL